MAIFDKTITLNNTEASMYAQFNEARVGCTALRMRTHIPGKAQLQVISAGGVTSVTMKPKDLRELATNLNALADIVETEGNSVPLKKRLASQSTQKPNEEETVPKPDYDGAPYSTEQPCSQCRGWPGEADGSCPSCVQALNAEVGLASCTKGFVADAARYKNMCARIDSKIRGKFNWAGQLGPDGYDMPDSALDSFEHFYKKYDELTLENHDLRGKLNEVTKSNSRRLEDEEIWRERVKKLEQQNADLKHTIWAVRNTLEDAQIIVSREVEES